MEIKVMNMAENEIEHGHDFRIKQLKKTYVNWLKLNQRTYM